MATREIYNSVEIVFTCSEAFHYRGEIIMEEHSLVKVISGELKVIQPDRTCIFGPGDTHLFPRNQFATLVKYEKDGLPYRAIVVKLTSSYLRDFYANKDIERNMPGSNSGLTSYKSPLLDSFFNSLLPYFELKYKLPDEISKLKIAEAVMILRNVDTTIDSLLADFTQPGKINLAEFMERNYMFNISLEQFGYLTGRSLTSFKRDFKKTFQTTPQRWLTAKRLELARYHIEEKRRKPGEVYLEAGFENLSHFSYAYKKQFGYAPTKASH